MSRRYFIYLICNFLAVLLLAGSPGPSQAQGPVAQAFPFQSGFPRSEPKGVIYFASPSVVDITGDPGLEVLTADGSGCVWAWNSKGQLLPGFPLATSGSCTGKRIGGPLAIADIDGDCTVEIVAGTRGSGTQPGQRGRVFVWKANGSLMPGWPKEMDWNEQFGNGLPEVYSVALGNVTGDTTLEVLAGTSNNTSNNGSLSDNVPNLYAWNVNGSLLPGYPAGYRKAGIYGLIGAADITGDGYDEVLTGRDHLYVYAYGPTGQTLPGWPVRTYVDPAKTNYDRDLYIDFTNNAPSMGDLDGDGSVEVVIAGKVKSGPAGHTSVNTAVLVIEPNGQRRAGWSVAKLGSGAPSSLSLSPSQAPALADLDGNGSLEIVVAQFDGVIRAYRANGELMWQYDYAQGRLLFGSEPVIGDVTGDGKLDIIFGTYSPDGAAQDAVALLGLDANGQPLPNFPLPLSREGNSSAKGIRAAPTLADLDGDGDVEILAGSQAGVLYAWDLPAPFQANLMPWPTSRHDNHRSGAYTASPLQALSAANLSPADFPYTIFLPVLERCTN